VHLDEWVSPDIADERGYLRGGKVLEWMDVVGVVAASRHCRMPVVTASVHGVVMRDPIRVGERVTMEASLAHTSDRSIGVSVSMTHGRQSAEAERLVLNAFMSFVAVDDDGRTVRVPQFVPETPAEVARFREGGLRRETVLYIREFLKSFPLTVLADVRAEDPIRGEHEETLRAFLTYAPVEPGLSPAPLTCEADDERAVFEEVEHRLALQRMIEPDAT